MAHYRNTIALRAERVDELKAEIREARRELDALDDETAALTTRWQEAVAWLAAPSAAARFRRGLGLGLGVVLMLPLLIATLVAGSGLPLAALLCLLR